MDTSQAVHRRVKRVLSALTLLAACAVIMGAQPGQASAGETNGAGTKIRQIVADSDINGGLVVCAGAKDVGFPASWKDDTAYVGQQLVPDRQQLKPVRDRIRASGLYGRVSAFHWDESYLPYAANTVTLLVVSQEYADIPRGEIERVLSPSGLAYVEEDGELHRHRKPWPDDLDQWTHARHDSTGNAVSADRRVGPPRHMQWFAPPRFTRASKISSMVTAEGRVFAILNDAHIRSTNSTWALVARDAFNGVRLWRHELPSWRGGRGGKKTGPVQTDRKLVTDGEQVYAPLEEFGPVSVLDAATGKVLKTVPETAHAEEIILRDGVLVVLINTDTPADIRRGLETPKRILAYDTDGEKLLWQHQSETVMPTTMAADDRQVVYHDGTRVQSLELRTGRKRWSSPPTGQSVEYRDRSSPDQPGAEDSTIVIAPQFGPTLLIYDDIVACAGGRQVNVLDAEDGRELWQGEYASSNYSVPVDMFGFNGLLWGPDPGMNLWRPRDDTLRYNGYAPRTGEVVEKIRGHYGVRFQHHRCHQMKAVCDRILAGRAGIEFLDTGTGRVQPHHWVRGSCYFGIMPANGMLYVPPHNCACYVRAKLAGFMALTSDSNHPSPEGEPPDFRRGPAFGETEPGSGSAKPGDWPTYRHDAARSGQASTTVSPGLESSWNTKLTGELTSPVVAGGRVFVAEKARHRIVALDAKDGEQLWTFTAGGRIDSPPTIYQGLALCGSRDGWVYALKASDGTLVWRFRAAPESRRIISRGQPESVWPVHGSVLAQDGLVYVAAGRSSYLDGGIHLYGLRPHSGKEVFHTVLDSRKMQSRREVVEKGIDPVDYRNSRHEYEVQHHPAEMVDRRGVDGFLNDILSGDGEHVFMRHQVFDLRGNFQRDSIPHLHGPDGYLSENATPRLEWVYGPSYTSLHQGAFYDRRLSRVLYPSGRILVEGEDYIYGFGQNHYKKLTPPRSGGQWALFAAPKNLEHMEKDLPLTRYRRLSVKGKVAVDYTWWTKLPIHVWAMLQSDETLFVAGPANRKKSAFRGKGKAALLAVSAREGKVLERLELPGVPAWDGMAGADGAIFLAARDGQVLRLGPE